MQVSVDTYVDRRYVFPRWLLLGTAHESFFCIQPVFLWAFASSVYCRGLSCISSLLSWLLGAKQVSVGTYGGRRYVIQRWLLRSTAQESSGIQPEMPSLAHSSPHLCWPRKSSMACQPQSVQPCSAALLPCRSCGTAELLLLSSGSSLTSCQELMAASVMMIGAKLSFVRVKCPSPTRVP